MKKQITKIELKKNQTIIIDGDSASNLRTGAGYTNWPYMRMMNWDRNWGDKFAELMFCWFPELNLKIRNVAVGGSKSYCILNRFDEFIKPNNPDWVFFTICGNDIAVKLSVKESQDNIEKYIKRVQDECGGNVVYISRFKPCPHISEKKIEGEEQRQERYAAIEETVAECGGFSIDVGTGLQEKAIELEKQWPGHMVYCADIDSHFNAIGHMMIAGEIMKALGYLN